MRRIIASLLTVLLAACSSRVTPAATQISVIATSSPIPLPSETLELIPASMTPEVPKLFTFQPGSDSTIPHTISPAMKNRYINPGAVIVQDNTFHMFFNSFTEWRSLMEIGYMTSSDGYTWTLVQEQPVLSFTKEQAAFGVGMVSSVVVMEDGTWLLYFHTLMPSKPVVGRATASSPLGPWAVDTEPVLLPGSGDSWDSAGVYYPSVIKTDEGLVMYYSAKDSRSTFRIGRATSTDGIRWEKYNSSDTTDAPLAESDPVLQPEDDWESSTVDRNRVQQTPDGWVMIYQGGNTTTRGLATSDDGITWIKDPNNPIINGRDLPKKGANTWDTALVHYNELYYYYMEVGSAVTDIYLATHAGSIK